MIKLFRTGGCLLFVWLMGHSFAVNAESPHSVGLAKLIVEDLDQTQAFYEDMFGMTEVKRYDYAPDVFEETIMAFGDGPRLALFAPNPKAEKPLPKSQFPVVLIYTPEFEQVTARIEKAGHPIQELPPSVAGDYQVAIARDPSGNAVEIFARPGEYAVGGSKLIVDDREKAEAFFIDLFDATVMQRYQTATYDEVLLQMGDGAFLALYQPLNEKPLPKSRFPVTAIYTSEFDSVEAKLKEDDVTYREVETNDPAQQIIIAQDPAGNAVEIIARP